MPLDDLPGTLVTFTRDEEIARWKRDYKLRVPTADVGDGTQPDIDARTFADAIMPLYADAIVAGNRMNAQTTDLEGIKTLLGNLGVPIPNAVGASGFVQIVAAAGGTTIFVGDELRDPVGGVRFRCAATSTYSDGALVPVSGIDTGETTNLTAGTTLQWTAPRPGCAPLATVYERPDGSGLTGGHDEPDLAALQLLHRDGQTNRPASGNDAEYRDAIMGTPGLPVEAAFTYPAILGPGTIAFAFTLSSGGAPAERIPTSAQVASALTWARGKMPADDSVFACLLAGELVDVAVRVVWQSSARGWDDISPWPAYSATHPATIASVTDALHFSIETGGGPVVAPLPGQTIALYDADARRFRRKRILSVSGGGPWTIACDASLNASDTQYVPQAGQRVSPWSESLDDLVAPMLAYFRTLGPGEQLATFVDDGERQRRTPPSPGAWPSTMTSRGLTDALSVASVFDVAIVRPSLPLATPVGVAGTLSRLLIPGDFAVHAE